MAMTAADVLKMRDSFVSLDDYDKDKKSTADRFDAVEKRVKCAEDKQVESDKVIVRVDTMLKVIMWLLITICAAVIGAIVTGVARMLFA